MNITSAIEFLTIMPFQSSQTHQTTGCQTINQLPMQTYFFFAFPNRTKKCVRDSGIGIAAPIQCRAKDHSKEIKGHFIKRWSSHSCRSLQKEQNKSSSLIITLLLCKFNFVGSLPRSNCQEKAITFKVTTLFHNKPKVFSSQSENCTYMIILDMRKS